MLAKQITYTDYNGVSHTETFYFNLSKADMENAMPRTRRMDTKGRVLYCDETQPDAPVSILAYSAG